MMKNIDEALIECLYKLLEDTYATNLREIMLQKSTRATFLETFQYAMLKWGDLNPTPLMEKHSRILAPWNPKDGMTKLWRHLNSCAKYGFYAGETVPDNILCDSVLGSY